MSFLISGHVEILLGTAPSRAKLCQEGGFGAFLGSLKCVCLNCFFFFVPKNKKICTVVCCFFQIFGHVGILLGTAPSHF